MNRQKIIKYVVISIIILILTIIAEKTGGEILPGGKVSRPEPGEGERALELQVELEKGGKYPYDLTIQEQKISEEEAHGYIETAKKEIDSTVFGEEEAKHVTNDLNIARSYANEKVVADWSFSDYEVIDLEGVIVKKDLSQTGTMIEAKVELTCGEYQEEYTFFFEVYPRLLEGAEKIISEIQKSVDDQNERLGKEITLPQQVDGQTLYWSEVKQHLTFEVAVFEVIIFVLLVFVDKEKRKKQIKDRENQMKLDYSDIVSKMAILLGSGMTIRQTWNIISARYLDEREKNDKNRRFSYDEMLQTYYEMKDGMSEKNAYQRFGESCGVSEYNRLSRLLVQNLQKGNRGLCELLEKEASDAFEERKLLAKKIGEEAGTKLLAPLMVVMIVVMAIVLFPAMLEFKG